MRELLSRIKAVLRRSPAQSGEATEAAAQGAQFLEGGDIRVDLAKHAVFHDSKPVELNRKEFELLAFLMSNAGRVISREQALRKVWGYDFIGGFRTVDVHIRWLRQKLETDVHKPSHIVTVRGYGYRFQP
jgi:DNA-binding response OmpR family regulator